MLQLNDSFDLPIRVGFDMDGVLADFAQAFQAAESRLFADREPAAEAPFRPDADDGTELSAPKDWRATRKAARRLQRRRDATWSAIRQTPDFWVTLNPIEKDGVRRLHALMLRHRWEVFFITQRVDTVGDSVQRQTQRWLVEQGFDLPSVLVLGGSRGAAASALGLTYHVDDNAQNCVDIVSDSRAKPILIVPDNDASTIASARRLGIGTTRSLSDCLDVLEQATSARTPPGVLERITARQDQHSCADRFS
jgi:hypothetical protein